MAQKKAAKAEARKAEVRTLGDRVSQLDREVAEVEAKRDDLMLRHPPICRTPRRPPGGRRRRIRGYLGSTARGRSTRSSPKGTSSCASGCG